mmetsp:Transcript_33049/g.53600  ORF Transcript_33049/g.53600 Transcript_33049/m.53600 type:complete len:405 (+) Transcript_33049:185-1399(+)|eukprot:CAMPEP_0184652340 /NCGR_PEP_ID=MMETSP0308-20130426/10042_1 /TAXON_ID=38269 /ORGANISM="Gloeochaete witrockiana, Strain SAG 46.84" /LENGTH=404 /DNA_ID=CAMNT_0027087169 /DNA_START=185 /DNA_END=1399 /DNA_ORIENTATION=-
MKIDQSPSKNTALAGLIPQTAVFDMRIIGTIRKVLVTGGAGYIGSHTCVELLNTGYEVVVVDNLCNSSEESLRRVKELTGRAVSFYKVDLLEEKALDDVFVQERPEAVIHFAGLKAVGESCKIPLTYYHNNITGTINLLKVMDRRGCRSIVFSSSATVYGDPHSVPIKENFPLGATNPYGRTKQMIEEIIRDISRSDQKWKMVILRYFNPVGAHESGRIGEDPDYPNNLMPYIQQVAVGRRPVLNVFGSDYSTVDGTGVRDYIHITDLARGHLAALEKISTLTEGCCKVYNLGTGKGISVIQMVEAMRRATGREIPVKFAPRRDGDIAVCYADPSAAEEELHWKAKCGLEEMCRDAWRWQSQNPWGYKVPQTAVSASTVSSPAHVSSPVSHPISYSSVVGVESR